MDFKIIKQVLTLDDLSSEQKLQVIGDIADKFEEMENLAEEKAIMENRPMTVEDKYEAAAELGVSFDVDTEQLKEMVNSGVVFIQRQQTLNGGWGRADRQRIPARLHDKLTDKDLPLPSAWVTAMALVVLQYYQNHFEGLDEIGLAAIEKGLDWLARNQNPNGSWSDVDRSVMKSPPNVIQTCMAICGLVGSVMNDFRKETEIQEAVLRGLNFLADVQVTETGGWSSLPLEPGSIPESKATSMAVFASLLSDKMLKFSTPIASDMTRLAVEWLISNQLPDGNWGYLRTPDSFLFGIYYSIEALMYYRLLNGPDLDSDSDHRDAVERSLRRAMLWYTKSNRLVRHADQLGWAWKNGDRSGDIANTAAAISILLDCAEEDFSFVIRKGIDFLIQEIDGKNFWHDDTSLVVYSFMKYLNPELRTCNALKKYLLQEG